MVDFNTVDKYPGFGTLVNVITDLDKHSMGFPKISTGVIDFSHLQTPINNPKYKVYGPS